MTMNIGNSKQLFLEDSFIVESTVGIRRVMHQPAKHPENPLIVADKPWEEWGLNYVCAVMYDDEEKTHKMWYVAIPKTERYVLHAYATSKDGIHWQKPCLGVAEFEGSKENNIIYFDAPGMRVASIIKDLLEKNPKKRYKMICEQIIPQPPGDALTVAFSPDGIHWNVHPTPVWSDTRGFDTNNTVLWDPRLHKYVAYVRRCIDGKRHVGRMESEDFIHWTTPDVVLGPDDNDPPDSDLYTPPVFKYSAAENAYFMLTSFFDWRRDQVWIQLATSRDGINWHRAGNREPFIPLGPPGAWDSECLYACAPPLIVDDKIYIYYGAYNIGHDRSTDESYHRAGGIGVATLRLDGFISLDAGLRGGVITTKPLQFKGSGLELNVDSPNGEVKVEILDEKGDKALPGYTKDDCDPVAVDSLRHQVTWKGKGSLDHLEGDNIRLRFHLKLARLYAFQFK